MSPIPEALLNLLKILLLVLVYLFFWRVLRAVWAEVNGPTNLRAAAAPMPKPKRGAAKRAKKGVGPQALLVVEPEDQRGRRFDLTDELTVGRAAGCQISLDDAYISQIHARVFRSDGKVMVEDLGSTNGTLINRKRLTRQTVLNPGDKLQVGSTVMELS